MMRMIMMMMQAGAEGDGDSGITKAILLTTSFRYALPF